ncbi:MAG: gliding motility-associated C-terminal domain-containing protein, partial [Saprospiraceae bacterium]|nr:gliding motility-associated C-terminal domain-containing protein [Saprospiraceae bacterium]
MLPLRVILLFVMASLVGGNLIAQSRWDCLGAIPICGNDTIDIISGALELNDFNNPNNDRGCLETGEGLHSTWVYFEFRDDMPPNSELEMVIFPPDSTDTWQQEDFDFAIYGPNLNCDSLGSPRRCSFARSLCSFCPYTGMGRGAQESQEPAFVHPITGIEVDGFILPLVAQPGDRFYMLVTKFTGFSNAFAIEWGGEASNYFNCVADPSCINLVNAGSDLTYCKADNFDVRLDASLSTNSDDTISVQWSGTPEAMALLDSANILQPLISVPAGFEGELEYEITVEQGLCNRSDKVKITVVGGVEPVITQEALLCPGELATVNVQNDFTDYEWSNGSLDTTVQVPTGEAVQLTVTQESGCQTTVSFTPAALSAPTPALALQGAPICGDQAATITINNTFSEYEWSDGTTASTLSVSTGDTYSVTVTDINGCTGVGSIAVESFDIPTVTTTYPENACVGDTVSLIPNESFASYQWSNGVTEALNQVANTGEYSLTVTDNNGCANTIEFPITFHEIPVPAIQGDTTLCDGLPNTLTVVDENLYPTIVWSNLTEGPSITVNAAATYEVLVVDEFGCRGINAVTLSNRPSPSLDIVQEVDLCPGSSVTLSPTSTHTGYTWSDGSEGASLEVDQGGTYNLTVTNEFGCTDEAAFLVDELVTVPAVIEGPVGLCPDQNGTLSLSNEYTSYQWSTGVADTNQTLDISTNVLIYSVFVQDANGCRDTASYDLAAFPTTDVQLSGNPAICTGQETVLKANPNMQAYLWSTGSTADSIKISQPGEDYSVTITDQNGCQNNFDFSVEGLENPTIDLPAPLQFCIGSSLNIDLGDEFTSVVWSTGHTDPTIVIDQTGPYGVSVVGQNGCAASIDFEVGEYESPIPQFSGVTGICPDGSTTIGVLGTWDSIGWSTGATTPTIDIDIPGPYTVTVMDAAGCTGTGAVDIAAIEVVQPVIQGPDGICPNTAFSLNVQDVYREYLWNDPNLVGATVEPTEARDFALTVTDFNGCRLTAQKEVTLLPAASLTLTGPASICPNEEINLTATGVFETVAWSTDHSEASIQVQGGGIFYATATNNAGCQATDTILVQELALPEVLLLEEDALDCNTSAVTLGNESLDPANYLFDWTGPGIPAGASNAAQVVVSDAGWYSLVIEDRNTGCVSLADSVEVVDLTFTPRIGLAGDLELDCDTPTVTVRDTNSFNANFNYQWYNTAREPIGNSNRPELLVDNPGSYFLQVLDPITGCNAMDSVTVTRDGNLPNISAEAVGIITCDNPDVSITATVEDWDPTRFEVAWQILEGELGTTPTALSASATAAGTFVLIVEDVNNGCTATDTIIVAQNTSAPSAIAGADQTLDCFDGEAALLAQPSESRQLDFLWTRPDGSTQAGETLNATAIGVYTLVVTDRENGCTDTDMVEVFPDENQPVGIEIEVDHPKCFGDTNGQVQINKVDGGQGPYLYDFDGRGFMSQDTFRGLPPGSYVISAQDAEGCSVTTEIKINPGRKLEIELGPDIKIEKGESITIKPEVSILQEEIKSLRLTNNEGLRCDTCWTAWQVQPEFSSVFVGTLIDENGCVAEDKVRVVVREPRNIYIPNAFSPNGDGNNDEFMIFSQGDVQEVEVMRVFDRWGDQVFVNKNFPPNVANEGWNGLLNGRPVINGKAPGHNTNVFVYMIKVRFKDGEKEVY